MKKNIIFLINLALSFFNLRLICLRSGKYSLEINKFFNSIKVIRYLFPSKSDKIIVFDVGAYEGKFSIDVCKIFGNLKCYLFEPNSKKFDYLDLNFSGNKYSVNKIAISNINTIQDFYLFSDESSGNSLIRPTEAPLRIEKVNVVSIDEFCGINAINLIHILKLDTQGNERNCLEGAKNLLSSGAIHVIMLEIMFHDTYDTEGSFYSIENILSEYDYRLWDISYIKKSYRNQRTLMVDVIYVSREKYMQMTKEKSPGKSFS